MTNVLTNMTQIIHSVFFGVDTHDVDGLRDDYIVMSDFMAGANLVFTSSIGYKTRLEQLTPTLLERFLTTAVEDYVNYPHVTGQLPLTKWFDLTMTRLYSDLVKDINIFVESVRPLQRNSSLNCYRNQYSESVFSIIPFNTVLTYTRNGWFFKPFSVNGDVKFDYYYHLVNLRLDNGDKKMIHRLFDEFDGINTDPSLGNASVAMLPSYWPDVDKMLDSVEDADDTNDDGVKCDYIKTYTKALNHLSQLVVRKKSLIEYQEAITELEGRTSEDIENDPSAAFDADHYRKLIEQEQEGIEHDMFWFSYRVYETFYDILHDYNPKEYSVLLSVKGYNQLDGFRPHMMSTPLAVD